MVYPRRLRSGTGKTRLLIFDDFTFEPLTFVRSPFDEQELYARRRIRLAVPPSLTTKDEYHIGTTQVKMDIVDIDIELFVRNRHGVEQASVIGFTKQEELAKLLVPEWFPGQQRAVDAILDRQEFLEELFLQAITR